MDSVGMSRQNDNSDKLSSRSKASKSSSNTSAFVDSKEDNRIAQLLDKETINKRAQEHKSKSFKEYSGSSPHLYDSSNTDGDREMPPAMYQVANQQEEFENEMKLRRGSYRDSSNREDCPADARHPGSKESSTRAKGLNGTMDAAKAKRNDTKSKRGNIAARTDVCDNRKYQKNNDPKMSEHVYYSSDGDSEAESKSTRGSRMTTSKRSVPIEYNSADPHDSNTKTKSLISLKVKAHDKAKGSATSEVEVKYTMDVEGHGGSIDELSVPANRGPKNNNNGGARSQNESCKSSLNKRSGVSVPKGSAFSDAETRQHYVEKPSEVRKTSDSNNSKIPVSDSDSDNRSSSSSRSSRSRGNCSSGSNRTSSSISRNRSDSSRSNQSRSNSSGSNSTRDRSNSSNGGSSRNGSQSSCEASVNSLNRLAGTGAIPRNRDGLTEVHCGSSKSTRSSADNTSSMTRKNSESNTSNRLIREDEHRNSPGRTTNGVQEGKRERSRRSETRESISRPETITDSSNLEDEGYNTRKSGPNHVNKSEKAAKEFGPSYHLNNSKPVGPNVHLEYEWQYRDDQEGWVTYGQSVGNAPGSKMVTSEDIEKYFTEDPDKTPLLIEFCNNKYILDFQKMKQTSQRTAYQRDIRRILKLPDNKNSSQKRGGHSSSRAASGRNITSGGPYGADYPLNAGDGRADRGMRYDNNTPAETNAGRGYAGNSAQGRDDPSVTYEWQFKDKLGTWIAYGNANTFFDKSNATTSRSEDIEKAYLNKYNMPCFAIKSSRQSYVLDFERMVQTNNQTKVERPIRRVVKESSKKDRAVKSVKKILGNLAGQKHIKKNQKEFSTPYEWQFMDEQGVWITYGQANSAGNVVYTTNTTSDDIEKYFSSGPHNQRMAINSTLNTYSLDFRSMTQTNTRTSIHRPIRRVLKNNRDDSERNFNRNTTEESMYANHGYNSAYAAPGRPTNKSASAHLWQFEDERGQWITYGESCSTVTGSGTTSAATDDIEEYYLKNNGGETPMFVRNIYNDYILDFQTMLQTNQSTYVQRRIRRITKPNEMTLNHRR